MKIKQEKTFHPITITLETKEEAEAFFDIMDTVDPQTKAGHNLAMKFSNAFSNQIVYIPKTKISDEYFLAA